MPRAVRIAKRKWTRDLLELVDTYGPVVRVAPDVLVYTGPEAWRDIYGHQNGAEARGEEFDKDPRLYRPRGTAASILTETRENHALLRRQLSHGFSEKSLRAQEGIVQGYVNLFISGLRERCVAAAGEGDEGPVAGTTKTAAFDMRHWFNFITFDVIGDLAFGEPFGCLEKGALDDRVSFLENSIQAVPQLYFLKELGLERYLAYFGRMILKSRKVSIEKTSAVLRRRMEMNRERPDLIEGLLKKQEDWVRSDRPIPWGLLL